MAFAISAVGRSRRAKIDPNGKLFGKTKLRMTTATVFARRARGYRDKFSMRQPKLEAA